MDDLENIVQTSQVTTVDIVVPVTYHKEGMEGSYPTFEIQNAEAQKKIWNDLIYEDFHKILQIYSFQPFPELSPSHEETKKRILNIVYDMKLNNSRIVSILYTASFHSPFSAYPTELVYTTNIDKQGNKRLRLSDLVKLNEDFVKDFRSWELVIKNEYNQEVIQAIREYINNMTDKELLSGFQEADQIASDNKWGIYSYVTPEKLGISISVPNYLGDHVEFERDILKLEQY